MQPQRRRKNTNIGVGSGALLQLAGLPLIGSEYTTGYGLMLILIGTPLLVWGCMNYAEGKGHSKWVGLVALAGIIGLIILVILTDQDERGYRRTLLRVAFLMSMMVGFVLVAYGVEVDMKHYGGPSPGPVPYVCMYLGAFLVVGSLVLMLMLRKGRR